ncbi:MAG: DUF4197 domain-containing protein [Chitinophagales bacterium]|nr:DUF4197 domain-containing protein [Chitinophagales bacterium]
MFKKVFPILFSISILFMSCESASQLLQTANTVLTGSDSAVPSSLEIGNGLKEALEIGISTGANRLSAKDGYLGNSLVKVLFPPEAQKVEKTMRDLGLGAMVDKAIVSFNRGAEKAAKEAAPIFVSAIKSMTINDAMGILLGQPDAATSYLKQSTYNELKSRFTPVIDRSLNEVQATKYWSDVITRYNQIPLVQKVNPDLTTYVTEKALDGLFLMVAKEELNIRDKVSARSTSLLQKVFAYADSKK